MSTDIAIVSIEFVFVVCRRADVGAMPSFAARTSDSRCCNSTWVSGVRRCSVAFLELVASSAGKRRPCLIYLRVVLDRKTKKKKEKKSVHKRRQRLHKTLFSTNAKAEALCRHNFKHETVQSAL